jgi:hypothetical protein
VPAAVPLTTALASRKKNGKPTSCTSPAQLLPTPTPIYWPHTDLLFPLQHKTRNPSPTSKTNHYPPSSHKYRCYPRATPTSQTHWSDARKI